MCRPNLVKGFMQLYSVEQNRSQALEAHAAALTSLTVAGKPANAIVFTTKTFANGVMNSKIHCIALGAAHKKQAELFFPAEFTDDFPVSLHVRCVSAMNTGHNATLTTFVIAEVKSRNIFWCFYFGVVLPFVRNEFPAWMVEDFAGVYQFHVVFVRVIDYSLGSPEPSL
jgi:hypothetical protein